MLWSDVNAIYQIYPRSFYYASGDGVGDLKGITQKLGYLKGDPGALGVDAIWISPFFVSPMDDFGYDVADYCDVDPIFGNLDDFDELIAEAHRRDIKVMIDYVPNHSSDRHKWFAESRSSRDNPKRDWYIWRDGRDDGSPPNNWQSVFGGSAWQYDETTGQYYLHSFLASQPDLNWANPEVQVAMADVLRFWMERGVDGVRADAVRWMSKHPELHDNPHNPHYRHGEEDPYHAHLQVNSRYGPHLFDYLKVIADTIAEYDDRIVLFEDYPDDGLEGGRYEQYKRFYEINPSVAAPFNFDGMDVSYNAGSFRHFINSFQSFAGNTLRPFYCFGNHDKPRLASRVGQEQARAIGMMQLTLPGIPVIYYGEELGMRNVDIPADKVQDPFELQTPGFGLGRDPGRTPMQWSDVEYAGFSQHEPWLPLADDYRTHNVVTERQDPRSSLKLYQNMLGLRDSEIMRSGEYAEWHNHNDQLFGYTRRHAGEEILVVFNMSDDSVSWNDAPAGQIIFSTHPAPARAHGQLTLAPHHGVAIYLD